MLDPQMGHPEDLPRTPFGTLAGPHSSGCRELTMLQDGALTGLWPATALILLLAEL